MSAAAIDTWNTFVKKAGEDKLTLENGDATDDAAIADYKAFNAARTAYVEAYITASLAAATEFSASEPDQTTDDAKKLALYAEFLGLEQKVAKQNAEAAANEASGGMGWLFGVIAGVAAVGGGYFAYKKFCKGGDDKEE